MGSRIVRESVRVLFHLNGYTKVMVERAEGVGLADGGGMWDISTEIIPTHLRQIGSRFIVQFSPPSAEDIDDVDAIRGAQGKVEILELR
jgi:hypothetical protein